MMHHKYIRTKSNEVYMSDVDDTLVMWDIPADTPQSSKVLVQDPFIFGKMHVLLANKPMIEMLKTKFQRGCYTVVWSQSGEEWANAVVEALGLGKYVNQTMPKPSSYGDDLPAEAWMHGRVYLKPDHKWRNNETSVTGSSNTDSK